MSDEYAAFEAAWLAELKPAGLIESELARSFIHATWLKRRVVDAQNQLLGGNPLGRVALEDEAGRNFDRLHKLEESYARRAERALRELRRVQKAGAEKKLKQHQQPQQSRKTKAGLQLVSTDKHSKLIH